MIDDAKDAVKFAEQIGSIDAFTEDTLYRKAIMMSIINIGELANHLPADFTRENKEIPWRDIIGIRNVVVHGYYKIDAKRAWDTVLNSIPKLLAFLEKCIEEQDNKESADNNGASS
jgi:uncharacterized protein with HEPN domain